MQLQIRCRCNEFRFVVSFSLVEKEREKQVSYLYHWLLIFMRDVTDPTSDDVTEYYRQ